MSNSQLIVHTNISPNKTSPRTHPIDTITIHCVVGQLTAEAIGGVFKPSSRGASSNYGVDKDGRIGMYVEEKDRSWCSSSAANDHRAVTIEIASDTKHPYAVTPKALAALIELCADICKRNGIKALLWKDDKSLIGQVDKQNMTVHRWFAPKSCPGDYLYERHSYIADEVNKRLNGIAGMPDTEGLTPICGHVIATAAQMAAYIKAKNPAVPKSVIDMIPHYISEGEAEGIRGDIAFAQSCLETGNFMFSGSSVTLDQNNFCGLGVTQNGMKGNIFDEPRTGIRAQIQHLKAYANSEPLAPNILQVDPRFKLVKRGVSPYVEWLGQKENPNGYGWATGEGYGAKILKILGDIMKIQANNFIPPEVVHQPSNWAANAWEWGKALGITDGTNPTAPATREQVIQMFYNCMARFAERI